MPLPRPAQPAHQILRFCVVVAAVARHHEVAEQHRRRHPEVDE